MAARTTQLPAEGQLLVSISDLSMLNDIKKAISMLKGATVGAAVGTGIWVIAAVIPKYLSQ